MSKHTPGPWHTSIKSDCVTVACGPQDREWEYDVKFRLYGGEDAEADAECIANARLISAAPDLLTALKLVATWMRRSSVMNTIGAVGEILRHAEEAIAKAEAP